MKLHFITINNFSLIPVTRFIIEEIGSENEIFITECFINNQYNYKNVLNVSYIGRFNDYKDFYNQSYVFKIWKTIFLHTKIFVSIVLVNHNIYTPDFQVLNTAIKVKKLFKLNTKIIYHQFELLESSLLQNKNKKIWEYIIKNVSQLSFVIFPEYNRLNYFTQLTNFPINKSFLFPNSCSVSSNCKNFHHELLSKIYKNKILIGHIGQIGCSHYYYELINIIEASISFNFHFVIIGNFDNQVSKALNEIVNPNVTIIQSLPHQELSSIYPLLKFGFILYKGVDKNFEFCAPNKLYEYWSYGIAVIAHHLSGLKPLFINKELGELFDFNSESSTKMVLNYLMHYKPQKKRIKKYFEDNLAIELYLKPLSYEFKKI
jgi:hypothetical protein